MLALRSSAGRAAPALQQLIAPCLPASTCVLLPPSRSLHSTPPSSSLTLAAGAGLVAATAVGARYALGVVARAKAAAASGSSGGASGGAASGSGDGKSESAPPPPSGGGFFGAQAMARRFYKGGFEDKMTRREAALILGVRESADVARVRDRHRKMLVLNHPDLGGSTFLAHKLNEAKEVLIGRGK